MRIILADHHAQPCWALKVRLEEVADCELIGEAVDAQGLLSLEKSSKADLILVDNEHPGEPIRNLLASLHALKPAPVVIVMGSEFECSRAALKAGADAFVSKGDQPDWLIEKLQKYIIQIKNNEITNADKKS